MDRPSALRARIVILNYNGAELLRRCLSSVVRAAVRSGAAVTVLDNGSTDDSEAWLREHYPAVDFYRASRNRVLVSYNEYLPRMSEPVAVLLNNDIRVEENFLDGVIEKFDDDRTFLVAPQVISFDGQTLEAGPTRSGFRAGMFWASARYAGFEQDAGRPGETFSSGFGAFSRAAFLALGGYDERFHPGIMEDADLCLRAHRAGYRLYYEPRSVVYHMGQASFHRDYGRSAIAALAARNNFLFMWKNFRGPRFWLPHLLFLPAWLVRAAVTGRAAFLRGFAQALRRVLS